MLKIILTILLILPFFNAQALDNLDNFKVIDTNGDVHTGKSMQGKFVVLNFWATWCPPCVKEMPDLAEFYDAHKDKVAVIGMNHQPGQNKEKIEEFTDGFGVEFPNVLLDGQEKQFIKFPVRFLPTTFIYNPEGKLISKFEGGVESNYLINITTLGE